MDFKKTTILLFSIIAILLSFTLFLFLYQIDEVENDGTIINIAGRQRMLSQKITKLCIQISHNKDSVSIKKKVKDLETSINQFEKSNYGLINGDKELNLHKHNSDSVHELFSEFVNNPSFLQ